MKKTALFLFFVLTISCKQSIEPIQNSANQILPKTPESLMVESLEKKSVNLSWEQILNAKGYRLYRDNQKIYEGSRNNYEDSGLKPETEYKYSITSFNDVGESNKSKIVIAKTKSLSLIDVVDDKVLVNFLNGKWHYVWIGQGYKSESYLFSFDENTTKITYVHSYNEYQYILDSKSEVKSYFLKVEKNILFLKTQNGEFYKFGRIEKVSDYQFKFYTINENSNSYSETLLGIFNKNIDSLEKSRDEVIKTNSLLSIFSGIWKEQANGGNKNITLDFSENRNYFWRAFETSEGEKKKFKVEFKVEADGTAKFVSWGGYFESSWLTYKITVSSDTKQIKLTGINNTNSFIWER